MGPGRGRTRDPWICSQTRICCQTRYRLRYAARFVALRPKSTAMVIVGRSVHLSTLFATVMRGLIYTSNICCGWSLNLKRFFKVLIADRRK